MFLLVKDNKVIKEMKFKGLAEYCDVNGNDSKKAFKKAKELNTDIYMVHNHPLELTALPSGNKKELNKHHLGRRKYTPTGDYREIIDILPKMSKEYGVKILDYGVATEVDYSSYKQSKKRAKQI